MNTTIKTEYHDNGQKMYEVNYKDGNKEGLYTQWDDNGQKDMEGNYKNGKEEGLWIGWYENGQKMHEVNYKEGKKEGPFPWWHENGQKRFERTFKDDKLDGIYIVWNENGQKRFQRILKDGRKEGSWIEWYENGQKKSEGNYKEDKREGLWTQWYENGEKKDEVHILDIRDEPSRVSKCEEYLCVERVSNKEFEISIRSYELLGDAFEFQDEDDDDELYHPDEIDGVSVVGIWNEYIIGGNLIPRSDEYSEVRFRDFEHKDVYDWLGSVNWDSKKTRKELKKLSKLEKDLQKTVEKWAQLLVGPNISHGLGGVGWNRTKSSVVQYILDCVLNHGGFPRGVHQVEIKGVGEGVTRTVNFDSARHRFGDDSIDEFISSDLGSEVLSINLESNEICYPSRQHELDDDKDEAFVFRGSLINGLEIDLLELSGLELTISDVDKIWAYHNERDVVIEELGCEEIDLYESDDMSGQSDSYYEYRCDDKGEFVRKLRAWIIKLLEEST